MNSSDFVKDGWQAGLWRITTCTATFVGGTAGSVSDGVVTFGSANTAVTVSCFSAKYENYKIIVSGGSASTGSGFNLTFGNTVTNYDFFQISGTAGSNTITGTGGSAATAFTNIVRYSSTGLNGSFEVFSPFGATRTQIHFASARPNDLTAGTGWGTLKNDTSYTSFTLTAAAGNVTGGTIRVYGYNN
jgi:hypothetical protein